MTAYTFNIIILTISLGSLLCPSHGVDTWMVFQPSTQTVNPDGSATISCEHNAINGSVEDIRLNNVIGVTATDNSRRSVLCQRGQKHCENIVMYQDRHNKSIFILLNIEEEAMNMLYECEFTLTKEELDYTKRGEPTRLLPAPANSNLIRRTTSEPVPPLQPPAQSHLFRGILIGLLALMFLYSCVITSFYIRLRNSGGDHESFPENSTYVEMRKGPVAGNSAYIYCG
ncbi:uncharacterized protein LOC122992283 [Scomber scombrus]|uniref:Uncharacterized protein LOC122992283 n=1 Tax=Scomber scombrus TaxID=13677 RepID=A0AAV1P728_SCOSC